MIWRRPLPPAPRPSRHGRHGRQGRSSVVKPPLPPLQTRPERFDLIVGDTAEYLRETWEELREASFEIGEMPEASDSAGIPRWMIDRDARRIVLFRLPIERLDIPTRVDAMGFRMMVEGMVFRAAAEFTGRDPWELGPTRWHD